MSEKNKMLSGNLYFANSPELAELRLRARKLVKMFNDSNPGETVLRNSLLSDLLGKLSSKVEIEPPFYCDYGFNIFFEENVFVNFNCTFLDCAEIKIGKNVLIGPGVQIYTASHPIDAETRTKGFEFAKPVTIEDNVWIGGAAIINAGITIGKNSIIGSGSVVTKNIPGNVIAAGNTCRVIKEITV